MYRSDVRTRLEGSLDPSPSPTAGPGNRLAAVLLPLVEDPLLLSRPPEHLSRHPGEISFPGGLTQDEDADLAGTALRETQEGLRGARRGGGVGAGGGARRRAPCADL